MPDARTVLIIAAIGVVIYVGDKTVQGVKKIDRKVCHVLTLGHKCKPQSTAKSSEEKK